MARDAQAEPRRPGWSSGYDLPRTNDRSGTTAAPTRSNRLAKGHTRRISKFDFETAVIRKHKGRNPNDDANVLGRLLRVLDEF